MNEFRFTFGDQLLLLLLRPVDMRRVRAGVGAWERATPAPVPPMQKRRWTGVDSANWRKISLRDYGTPKHPAVRAQLEAELEEEENPHDEQYKSDLLTWQAQRLAEELNAMLDDMFPDGWPDVAYAAIGNPRNWQPLRDAIANISELTDQNVSAAIRALNRIYKGEPLLTKWQSFCDERGLTEKYEQNDSWHNRAADYIVAAGEISFLTAFEGMPIPDQCRHLARLITQRMTSVMDAATEPNQQRDNSKNAFMKLNAMAVDA